MSNAWDLSNIRKLAGLQINESKQTLTEGPWYEKDDDADEDRDARVASSDKRQAKFEKKNKSELTTANKQAEAKKAESKAEAKKESKPDAEKKPEEKKESAKEVEKKEVAAAEAKRRGKAPNENSFNQQAKMHAKTHTRGTFIKWASETHGKGKNYASALFAKYNPKSSREVKTEAWILVHPHMPTFTLAENVEMNQLQWVDSTSPLDSMVFATEAEAQKTLTYLNEWKNWSAVLEHIVFEQD